ncbi:hypothetical protein [Nitrincola nitratireducens]|uniref:SHOCT domain-containing protein n=1 Tax=Nitrincola nitratireducens TaxID=1229521 RepID=W9UYJ0_9GAMM|nr:hypothetical protein [Nitrincola nitratireducens]EXJ12159.1 hypothetical protein D791_01048 [Nitrincola nitratireducens]
MNKKLRDLLDERLAKGEISIDEYKSIVKEILDKDTSSGKADAEQEDSVSSKVPFSASSFKIGGANNSSAVEDMAINNKLTGVYFLSLVYLMSFVCVALLILILIFMNPGDIGRDIKDAMGFNDSRHFKAFALSIFVPFFIYISPQKMFRRNSIYNARENKENSIFSAIIVFSIMGILSSGLQSEPSNFAGFAVANALLPIEFVLIFLMWKKGRGGFWMRLKDGL